MNSCYHAEVYRIQGSGTQSTTISDVNERDELNEVSVAHGNTSHHYQCEGLYRL